MKKIIKPKTYEEAIYFSDFSGKPFGTFKPPVELNIVFNYGSIYDSSEITLHLDDKDMVSVLELIKNKLNPDCIKQLKESIYSNEDKYNDAVESKDIASCEIYGSTNAFLKTLIGESND